MKCQMVIYTQTWWDSSTRAWTENWKRENCKGKWVVLMALLLYPNVKAWTHKQGCKKKKFSLSVSNAHDSLWAFMRQAKNNMNTLLHRITHRHYLRTSTASECIFQSYLCTLVTRIVEVLRIAEMGWKFFHVMIPLEDMVKFMDANMVWIGVLVCQV